MEITQGKIGEKTVYTLKGRFDAHEVSKFKRFFKDLSGNVILDFAEVSFIDSTGLATLVALYKRLSAQGMVLRMINLQDQVRVIFEITQLHTVLPIETPISR